MVKLLEIDINNNKKDMINHIDRIKQTVHPCQSEQREPTIKYSDDKKIDMKSFAFF